MSGAWPLALLFSLLALLPPPGTKEPKPFKRPDGAPMPTVVAPLITATLCIILFFAVGPISKFLSPTVGDRVEYIADGGQP